VGLGSDLFAVNDRLRTVTSPYPDPETGEHEELVAVPALSLDAALVHANRADARGNAQFLGPDPYFDDLMAAAATDTYVSCERLVATEALLDEGPIQTLRIPRLNVTGVVEAPAGAHPTSCQPDYEADDGFLGAYAATAKDAEQWATFLADRLQVDEATYRAEVES
jgi:glutaconate CoA-transferase subunit A